MMRRWRFNILRWGLIVSLLATGLAITIFLGHWLAMADRPLTRNAVAQQLLQSGEPDLAAYVFEDSAWRAVALYRDQRYRRAFQIFIRDSSLAGRYNAASALAWLRQYDTAIAILEAVLQAVPDHADARHNLEVIRAAAALAAETDPNNAESGSDRVNTGQPSAADDGAARPNSDVQSVASSPDETNTPDSGGSPGSGSGIGSDGFDNPQLSQSAAGGDQLHELDPGLVELGEDQGETGEPGPGGSVDYTRVEEQVLADEILLRRIVDDPATVLRARLNAAAKRQ